MYTQTLAALTNPILPANIGGGTNPNVDQGLVSAGGFIASIVSLLLIVTAVATLIYLVLGGLQWVTSSGEKTGLEAARNKITNAIVGLIIVAAAWAVWLLVGRFFGIDFQKIPFPTLSPTTTTVTI